MSVAFPSYTPAPSRTIVVSQPSGTAPRVSAASIVPLRFPAKNAIASLDFQLDLDAWLGEVDDVLVGASASVVSNAQVEGPTDAGLVWTTVMAGRPVIMLSGGVPGQTYTASVTISTMQGREEVFPVAILTTSAGIASTPQAPVPIMVDIGPIVLEDGTPFILGDGTPILVAGGVPPFVGPVAVAPNTLMSDATNALILENGVPFIIA